MFHLLLNFWQGISHVSKVPPNLLNLNKFNESIIISYLPHTLKTKIKSLTFAPNLMDIGVGFFKFILPIENPIFDTFAGVGLLFASPAAESSWSFSSAALFSAFRLELSPSLLEETVLVFTVFSAFSSGPGGVETTYQDEILLSSTLTTAATSISI